MRGSAVQALAVLRLGCLWQGTGERPVFSRGLELFLVLLCILSSLVRNVGILLSELRRRHCFPSSRSVCCVLFSGRIPSALPLALSTSRNVDAMALSIQLL